MRECNVRFRALVPARRASGAPNINRPLRPVVASLKGERSLAERTPSQAKECAIVPVAGLEGGEVSALVSVQIGDRVAYRALDLLEHTA
jgi:hypothetical protein